MIRVITVAAKRVPCATTLYGLRNGNADLIALVRQIRMLFMHYSQVFSRPVLKDIRFHQHCAVPAGGRVVG